MITIYTNKQASFHSVSRQGRIWRLGSNFQLVRFRIDMSHENNSSSVQIAQLRSVNSAVRFAWFHKFSEPPPKASTWAHSRCRSTAWSLGVVPRKFSDFGLIPLNIHPGPTISIAKAAIMLNDVGLVSCVHLLMHAASHWYRVFKNHNGRSRTALCMPRNKVDSEANGFTETTSAIWFFKIFFYSQPWGVLDISWGMLWT